MQEQFQNSTSSKSLSSTGVSRETGMGSSSVEEVIAVARSLSDIAISRGETLPLQLHKICSCYVVAVAAVAGNFFKLVWGVPIGMCGAGPA